MEGIVDSGARADYNPFPESPEEHLKQLELDEEHDESELERVRRNIQQYRDQEEQIMNLLEETRTAIIRVRDENGW